ncbi:MAG: type IV secretion system protein [Pseudomonadota bacterium]
MRKYLFIVIISLVLLTVKKFAYATMPVVDYAAIAKLMQQVNEMKRQYTMLENQYRTAENQLQSLTGQRGWGSFGNSDTHITNQFGYAPDTYSQAMNGQGGSADYQQNRNAYIANHHVITEQEYESGTTINLAEDYHNRTQTTAITAASATTAFNSIQDKLKEVRQLAAQIDASKNDDLKSAIDLQTRVDVQLAYIQIQAVQLQATLNREMAEAHASEQVNDAMRAEYNTISNNS